MNSDVLFLISEPVSSLVEMGEKRWEHVIAKLFLVIKVLGFSFYFDVPLRSDFFKQKEEERGRTDCF